MSQAQPALPVIIDPEQLASMLDEFSGSPQADLRVLDVRKMEHYVEAHIPGATHVDPAELNRTEPPVGGLLPEKARIEALLSRLGSTEDVHLVVYDGGAETAAARLLWVLDTYGVSRVSWLNGGLASWLADGRPVASGSDMPSADESAATTISLPDADPGKVVTSDDLIAEVGSANLLPVDARSAEEYAGSDVRSARGGHVPGAAHQDWRELFDDQRRLLPDADLERLLETRGIARDRRIVVYCQTHQRSAVTYVMLKHLGYTDVRALDGAWSSWGNRSDTPIEAG